MPTLTTSHKLKLGYLALAALDTWLSGSQHPRAHNARRVTKPLLMPTLAASLLTDERAAASPLRTSTLLAQVGGWGGDVALLGEGGNAFATGMASFGAGHAAYISGFHGTGPSRATRSTTTGKIATAMFATTGPLMAWKARGVDAKLGPATLGYAAALSTMLAHAGNLGPQVSPMGRRLTLLGAATFAASDTALGLRKFVLSEPPAALERLVMATYTAGQFLLSEGAARA